MCSATTAVSAARRAQASWARCGQRPSTARAVGSEVWKAFHTSGNAHRASDNSRRRYRLASVTAEPRRTHRRRSANSAGLGRRSGVSSNTSPARASTSASMTSVLFLPLIAPRSREAWREPSSANWPPVSVAAIDRPSQVIEVGSATATAPGYAGNCLPNEVRPARAGWTRNR